MNDFHEEIPVVPALFPGEEDRRTWNDFLTVALSEARRRIPQGGVGSTLDPTRLKEALSGFDFQSPRSLSDLLPWTIDQLEHGVVHMTHPRYFGLFNPSPSFPAECAERIVASFNPQLAASTTSPAAVEMEAHVIRMVAQRAGFAPTAAGHFTTSGSEANFTALVCALTDANPGFSAEGIRAFPGAPILYVSEDAHVAWYKIAHQTGIGRSSVRLVATDQTGRMDPQALTEAIAADKARGNIPVMIVATAGTTNAGMIDPIRECVAIARATGTWLHVDAAWGGALIASDKLRGLLSGIEAADSITIDAHKWFATTMSCGMFITSRAEVLSDSFHVASSFMRSNLQHLDPYVTTAQWSRRFLGLRLFLSLAAAGWHGYAEHIERSIRLTSLLRDELVKLGWRVANDSQLAVLCVDPPPGFPRAGLIARTIIESNQAWLTSTSFRSREVVRICVTNGETMPEDILALARLMQGVKARIGLVQSFN